MRELDRAGERRVRELARVVLAEAQVARRLLQPLEEIEHVGRTAAGDAGHCVEHVLALHPDDLAGGFEHPAGRGGGIRRVTAGGANAPLMPAPTSAGVFGIARTMRG